MRIIANLAKIYDVDEQKLARILAKEIIREYKIDLRTGKNGPS